MSKIKTISLSDLNKMIRQKSISIVERDALFIVKKNARIMCNDLDNITEHDINQIVSIRRKAENAAAEEAIEFDQSDLLDSITEMDSALSNIISICFIEDTE